MKFIFFEKKFVITKDNEQQNMHSLISGIVLILVNKREKSSLRRETRRNIYNFILLVYF